MITNQFPPDYGGGARQAFFLSKRLIRKGIDVEVVTRKLNPKGYFEYEGFLKVHRLSPVMGKKINDKFFYFNLFFWLLRHARKFDVFHGHSLSENSLIATLVAKITNRPVILKMTLLGRDDPLSLQKTRKGRFNIKIFSLAEALISISSELTELYLKSELDPDKLLEIPNGVDLDIFKPTEVSRIINNDIRVLFCGTISPRKGVDTLIRAWSIVQKEFKNAKLIIVGPVWRTLKKELLDLKNAFLGDIIGIVKQERLNVEFTGLVNNVESYYSSSTLFVLPTKREGLPNSLLEAMASGLPVVVGDIQGIRDVVKDRHDGLITSNDDPGVLATSIIKCLQCRSLREKLGQAARKTVELNFNLDIISDRYIEIYKRLILQKS